MKKTKKINSFLPQIIAGVMTFVLVVSAVSIVQAKDNHNNPEPKIRICHRTNAFKNPYRSIVVNMDAVDGVGKNDHSQHTGPVFNSQTMNQHSNWGDIIPNILNWNTEGQKIWNNNCRITVSTPTPTPSVIGGGGSTPQPKISPQVLGTTAPTPTPEVAGVKEQVLVSAGVDTVSFIYWLLIVGVCISSYYLKVYGWKRLAN